MNPISKLRASMLLTLATVISISTLLLMAILIFIIPSSNLGFLLTASLGIVLVFHIFQWLLGPKIIDLAYSVRPLPTKYSWIKEVIHEVSAKAGISKPPEPVLADIPVPNAFAYGNFISGYKVAVTKGLVSKFPREEVEAIIGHELGHVKHRDVELMMIVSIIPALILWIGRSLMLAGWFSGGEDESEASLLPLIGISLIAISFLFNFVILYISRLREYYADSHSALVIPDGARKLQRALARILVISEELKRYFPQALAGSSKFKTLMISDPETGVDIHGFTSIEEVVEWIKSRPKLTPTDFFSTHPDPAKRLRFLDELARSI